MRDRHSSSKLYKQLYQQVTGIDYYLFTPISQYSGHGWLIENIILVKWRTDSATKAGIVTKGYVDGTQYLLCFEDVIGTTCLVIGANAQFGYVSTVGVFGELLFQLLPVAVVTLYPNDNTILDA